MVKYTPELELLLCCAHICVDSETQQRIRDLSRENLDWQYLLQLAQEQKMRPLLYWHLNENFPAFVLEATLHELQQYFNDNVKRNELLTQELFRLLDLFKQQQIPVLPYKGPSLALSTHGNIALRHWWDLDLVVDEQNLCQAKELLIQEKYYSKRQYKHEESFVHGNTKINVDLHWKLATAILSFNYDFQRLWQRRTTFYVSDRKLVGLLLEDLLLILCIQITKDFYVDKIRLVQLCDLSELIRTHQEINWNEVIAQAKIMNCERPLFICLLLVNELLGTVIPPTVRERIKVDSQIKEYATKFRNWLVSKPHSQDEIQDKMRQWQEELIDLFPALQQLQQWRQELMNIVSEGQSFILVDQEEWHGSKILTSLKTIPFLERDGQYWGLPANDATAIRELERLRQAGASYIIFASNSFWWLDYYADFSQYLQSNFDCVFKSDHSIAFRLVEE